MKFTKSAVVAALTLLSVAQSARGDSFPELSEKGYQTIWKGYASVPTCIHGQDSYELGPFLFVCNQYTYEYPYYYGDVTLVSMANKAQGRALFLSYLCLGETEAEDCIQGSVNPR